jgi:hypothetical protein
MKALSSGEHPLSSAKPPSLHLIPKYHPVYPLWGMTLLPFSGYIVNERFYPSRNRGKGERKGVFMFRKVYACPYQPLIESKHRRKSNE